MAKAKKAKARPKAKTAKKKPAARKPAVKRKVAAKKPKAKKRTGKKSGLTQISYAVSPELQAIIGSGRVTRPRSSKNSGLTSRRTSAKMRRTEE